MNERRASQRFTLSNDNFVIHARNVGRIENISLGGLCCTCINEDLNPAVENTIDIRCPQDRIYIAQIGIQLLQSRKTGGASIFNVFTRTCRLKFQQMEEGQRRQLHQLMLKHGNSQPGLAGS